jgi:hypothetical protein
MGTTHVSADALLPSDNVIVGGKPRSCSTLLDGTAEAGVISIGIGQGEPGST